MTSGIENWFSYHSPQHDQLLRFENIRSAAKHMAEVIDTCCPPCADKSAAIRKVREAVMTANAAIACEPKSMTTEESPIETQGQRRGIGEL